MEKPKANDCSTILQKTRQLVMNYCSINKLPKRLNSNAIGAFWHLTAVDLALKFRDITYKQFYCCIQNIYLLGRISFLRHGGAAQVVQCLNVLKEEASQEWCCPQVLLLLLMVSNASRWCSVGSSAF